MKKFYAALAVIYGVFLWWYGGSSDPVSEQELNTYIAQFEAANQSKTTDTSENIKYMRRLAASDQGGEFYMVNLMDFRDAALYPPESPWASDPDALAADARYSAKVVPLLLKRASHPMLVGPLTGTFIIEGEWGNWDSFAIVRYRSVKDMLEMMIEMAHLGDVALHKWASMEKTQVFPIQASISLPGPRFLVAALLIGLALIVRAIAGQIRR